MSSLTAEVNANGYTSWRREKVAVNLFRMARERLEMSNEVSTHRLKHFLVPVLSGIVCFLGLILSYGI